MSIQGLRAHWGFTRSPFTKDLAPSMLHRHAGHAEAVARIAWCVDEAAIGVVTGEVGAGKTVSIRAALDQRIALRYALPPMSQPETGDYISHHLKLAGRSDTLFSDDAVARIHKASRGLPRAVNNLAVQALIAAYAAGASIVDDKAARAAVTEVTSE